MPRLLFGSNRLWGGDMSPRLPKRDFSVWSIGNQWSKDKDHWAYPPIEVKARKKQTSESTLSLDIYYYLSVLLLLCQSCCCNRLLLSGVGRVRNDSKM